MKYTKLKEQKENCDFSYIFFMIFKKWVTVFGSINFI